MFIILLGHSFGGTHLFISSLMIVPGGHSQPWIIQGRMQGNGLNLLVHVIAQLGSAAHSFLICPSTGHANKKQKSSLTN